ncbi:hypothetical protein LTR84_007252 [Exophiala bonariae]|uniref:Cytochrome P450 oxidoreductase n=1 Tax=Exophiala bonariae TaxID=1690606 RepID=A0AAV9N2A5_9EURO|nr:hypothetical protein LTR84_007252 [Exophiala bonariae]
MDSRGILSLGVAVVILSFTLLSIKTGYKKELRQIPGPFFARFSGLYRLSLVLTGRAPLEYRRVHQEYGSIVRVGPNHVSISDPVVIPQIYGIGADYKKTHFYNVFIPYYKDRPMQSLFATSDTEYHKALKRPVAQLFSMTNMKHYEIYINECTKIFMDIMQELQDQPIDLGMWLQFYAFDVIASVTFQRRFGFMENRTDVDNMIGRLSSALQYGKVIGQFPGLHPWLIGNKRLLNTIEAVGIRLPDPLVQFVKITEDEIERYDRQAKIQGMERTDFLAQLRTKDAQSGQISYRDMVNHLSNNILAGSDTTAISLRACFYYLMKTPRAYEALVAEIDGADSRGLLSSFVTYDECLRLPYLQAVMKEAMRMHPGVAFPLERYVPRGGATLCGVWLPEGTTVSVNAAVIHMDKVVYGKDADQFRPERWIDASPERLKMMERSFLAFGYGSRTCIGKNISILEMGKFLPQILRDFDVIWAAPEPEWKLHAAWFWMQSGMIAKFRWRQKSH